MFLKFPKNFLWGTSTSAHQVEGNNCNDWTEWEKQNTDWLTSQAHKKWAPWQQKRFPEMFKPENYISGKACDHYNLYEKDFDIAKQLGHNAHRFSIEWSRIEPKEGKFDKSGLAHYGAVIRALKTRGMEPFVTLWHWTLPPWLSKKGGVLSDKFDRYFSRYVEFVCNGLKDDVEFWITLNEPTSVIANSYLKRQWPPQKMSVFAALKAYTNLSKAHNLAYDQIHRLSPKAKVGLANILTYIEPRNPRSFIDRILAKIFHYYSNEKIFKLTSGRHDFLAIQYYFHNLVGAGKEKSLPEDKVSDMGWEIYPKGIRFVLEEVRKYNLPIFITENGIADKSDSKRSPFMKSHIIEIHKAIEEGVDVRGYFYWSLLDNFEWDKGFWPRFGLVEIDYKTQRRTIRESAFDYQDIIQKNGVEL